MRSAVPALFLLASGSICAISPPASASPPADPLAVIHEELGPDVPVVEEAPFLLAGPGWTVASLHTLTTCGPSS
jgi:hypothetical protein